MGFWADFAGFEAIFFDRDPLRFARHGRAPIGGQVWATDRLRCEAILATSGRREGLRGLRGGDGTALGAAVGAGAEVVAAVGAAVVFEAMALAVVTAGGAQERKGGEGAEE